MLQGGRPAALFARYLKQTVAGAANVLDIGTSQRFAKELRPYERWFDNKHYVAAGYRPQTTFGAYTCDCHQDIHALTFATGSFDAVLCIEVLEHVADPFQAVRELKRVLRPGGTLLLTTPFMAGYHGKRAAAHAPDHGSYPDFWRFTHQGLQQLFVDFATTEVVPLDGPIEMRLKQFYLTNALALAPLRRLLDSIDRPRTGKATTRHLLWGVK